MTEHHLPDDFKQWPSDPHALLGVSQDASERDLKRAYTKLIRRFNPEHAPEEFRLIREAYESAKQQLSWRIQYDFDDDDEQPSATESDQEPAGETDSDDSVARQPRQFKEANDVDSQINNIWKSATPENYFQSYQQLVELRKSHPHDEEIAIRLYWLKVLDPTLDKTTSETDLLQPILARTGITGRAGELFIRSLERSTDSQQMESLGTLATDSRNQSRLHELLRIRWAWAARHGKWNLIEADLGNVEALLLDDSEGWLSVHLLALQIAKFSTNEAAQAIIKRCREIFETEKEQELQFEYLFDQAEQAYVVSAEIDRFVNQLEDWQSTDLRQLLLVVGANPQWETSQKRQQAMKILSDWVQSPGVWLESLSLFSSEFPALTVELFKLVNEIYYETLSDNFPTDEELKELLEFEMTQGVRITNISYTCDYEKLQSELLHFCISEYVDVDQVAIHLAELRTAFSGEDNSWLWRIQNDLALRIMVRGCLAFWAPLKTE